MRKSLVNKEINSKRLDNNYTILKRIFNLGERFCYNCIENESFSMVTHHSEAKPCRYSVKSTKVNGGGEKMKGEEREGICEAIGNYKNLFTVPLQTSPTMTTYKNQYFHTSLTFVTRWQH